MPAVDCPNADHWNAARSCQQGKINVRLKQSNHNHNLVGFETIEINLAVSAGVVDNIFDIIVCVIVVVIVAVVFLDKKNPAINLIKNRRGNS